MRRWLLGLGIAGVALLILGWGLQHHLLEREAIPEQSSFALDLEQLRVLATAIEGPLPLRVNHEAVAGATMPRAAVLAGEPFTPHRMIHGVHQIVFPDGFILVDAAFGPGAFGELTRFGEGKYDGGAFERVQRALEQARLVVLTHEHFDHLQGLGEVDVSAGLAERLLLNEEQHSSDEAQSLLSEALLGEIEPIVYASPHPIAPGVVLVRAAGHTPGSQIIYVRMEDERELLLVGDVVWHMDALRNLHYRPRLITDLILGEDRAAVMSQIRTLHDLLDLESLRIVVAHDAEQRRELVKSGWLGDGLELGERPRVLGRGHPIDG